jgi:tetratricopeptide (TPR) repeat protein
MALFAVHRASAPFIFAGIFMTFRAPASYNINRQGLALDCNAESCSSFGNPCRLRKSPATRSNRMGPDANTMDKIAGLKEILTLDPRNSFARYGLAMELTNRGDAAAALAEFDTLLANDPDYTAGYFMSAQTLAAAGRRPEAVERLKAGMACAARSGNRHALSEMQAMLDELER